MKNEEIEKLIISGSYKEIEEKCTKEDLLSYTHKTYRNIFLHAARDANVETLKVITQKLTQENIQKLESEYDLHDGRGILALAVVGGKKDVVMHLIELGAKINLRDSKGRSAIWFSIERNKSEIFEYLLVSGSEFGEKEQEIFGKTENFKEYFNTPECFLFIVELGNYTLLNLILRHIKFQPESMKVRFLEAKKEGKNSLYLAFNKPNIKDSDLIKKKMLELYYNTVFPTTQIEKEKMGNLLSTDTVIKQDGALPKLSPEQLLSKYRSYAHNREVQILRHISTQLYFYLKSNLPQDPSKDLVEIQAMHLEYDGNHHLFFAANKHWITKDIINFIVSIDDLKQKMITQHTPSDPEGKKRSIRFSKKLDERIYKAINIAGNTEESDHKHVTCVAEILRAGEILPLHIEIKDRKLTEATRKILEYYLKNKKNKIFMLVTEVFDPEVPYKLRHAEEFLTDIADHASNLAKQENKSTYTCIAGKKRPCIGCSGRMEGSISKFGPNPGLFWSHTIKYQSDSAVLNTIKVLITKQSHVTVCFDGNSKATDYDSGSDSEPECEKPDKKDCLKIN